MPSMRALRQSIRLTALTIALALLSQGGAAFAEARPARVGGRVLSETSPLAAAQIYAYQLADLSLHKVLTDAQGNFLFRDLPAGLYQIIAHKAGFLPVVVMLPRATARVYQSLELRLAQRGTAPGASEDDFWAVRSQVPADVLRDIETSQSENIKAASFTGTSIDSLASSFKAEMQARTGVDHGSQLSGGGVI